MFEDPKQRASAIAVWAAGATGGAAVGPLVGGALLERFWWGSVFLINVPVMLLVVVCGIALLPESKHPAGKRSLAAGAAIADRAGGELAAIMGAARHAFIESMRVTSLVAAALLVLASVVAWRLIPSTQEVDTPHDRDL